MSGASEGRDGVPTYFETTLTARFLGRVRSGWDHARRALMTTTAEAINLPFEEAIRFFREKASVTTRSWTDVYATAHSRAFMVAGAATDALVSDFRAAIDKALADGTTLADFRKDFDDIVGRHGWDYRGGRNWRSRIIFETNLKTAYAAGRHAQMTSPETLEAFPFWEYNHSGAVHARLDHLSWDGMVLRADDPFWKTNYPPNGWGCGCFVIPVSRRDLGRLKNGSPDQSPDLVFRAEEVGGRTVRVPNGVDPGFEYNPGQAWAERTMPGSETVAAAPGMIRRFVDSAIAEVAPDASWTPVALLPGNLAAPLSMDAGAELRLTAGMIRRHLQHAGAREGYETLPELAMETATVLRDAKRRVTLLMQDVEGADWVMGLKPASAAVAEITTLHRLPRRQVQTIQERGRTLREGKTRPEGRKLPR